MENGITNLFDNPTTLRDPERFVGRRSELERIFDLLKSKQSVALIGPRRIGKTSLLTVLGNAKIQAAFGFDNPRFQFFYLDLQKHSMKNKEHANFLMHIYLLLKEQSQISPYLIDEDLETDDQFDMLLEWFKKDGRHPVLLMDAFDEIKNYKPIDENIFGFLRSQGSEGKISFITSSMDAPYEIFRKHWPHHVKVASPLYNIFAIVRLSSFSQMEAQTMLIETSTKGGLPFSEAEVNWITQLAGTHPYLLQQVATLLFEAKRLSYNINYSRLEKDAQRNVFGHFEDARKMLSEVDYQLLEERIASAKHPGKIHTDDILPEFSDSSLLYQYLQHPQRVEVSPLITIEARDFKDLLSLLDWPEKLGKSELVRIPFIEAQIEEQQATQPAERGQIVKRALQAALQKMAGPGERSDGDRSWLHYNILYYRYFIPGHGMNQRLVAHRLGFSERQYYRFFAEALERFRNALLAIDASAMLKHDD